MLLNIYIHNIQIVFINIYLISFNNSYSKLNDNTIDIWTNLDSEIYNLHLT